MRQILENPPLAIKIPAGLLALVLGIWPHILPAWAEPFGRPLAGLLAVWLCAAFVWHAINDWRGRHKKSPIEIKKEYIGAGCGLAFVGALCYAMIPVKPPDNTPPLLEQMENDFPGMDELIGWWNVQLSETSSTRVTVIIYSDIRTMTKFVAFYVPDVSVFETCKHLAGRFDDIIEGPPTLTINGKPVHTQSFVVKRFMGDPDPQSSLAEKFTGVAYIYYEGNLTDEERVELRREFAAQNITLMFRGEEFLPQGSR
jgi:hypothetical protein